MGKKRAKVDLDSLVRGQLLRKHQGQVQHADAAEQLAGKYVAVFFYMMNSSGCQELAYKLRKPYLKLVTTGHNFEVLMVPTDPGEDPAKVLKEYGDSMPWLAIPPSDHARAKAIRKALKVSAVPKLILLSPEREVINRQVMSNILLDPEADNFPWEEPLAPSCCCI